ncbi:MAG: pentapeptide repeat-containing protein [Propionibacteriales bacterium]|nr:pentapeptide repeat-containing protein [Propionibacteriales bacterium]
MTPGPTKAPRTPQLRFGALAGDVVRSFVDAEGDDLEDVRVAELEVSDLRWEVRRRLADSQVSGLTCHTWKAPALTLNGCRLERLDVVALSAPNAGWTNSEFSGSRIGSIEAYDASLRQVSFTGCKLGYVNLRGAEVSDVAFTDCVIEDLDLSRAQASRVSLAGCRITRLELANSKLRDVDLRGATLGDVVTPDGLRGATVSTDQLLDLAPILAARLGLVVE